MQTKPVFSALIAVTTLSLLAWALMAYADDKLQLIPDRSVEERPPSRALFMQAKMSASQRVLEGLLNRDFHAIETAAATLGELADAVLSPKGELRDEKIYDHFRVEFMRQSTHLQKMAAGQNLEGAAFVYQNMTSTCIACHQHLRDVQKPLPNPRTEPGKSDSQPQGIKKR